MKCVINAFVTLTIAATALATAMMAGDRINSAETKDSIVVERGIERLICIHRRHGVSVSPAGGSSVNIQPVRACRSHTAYWRILRVRIDIDLPSTCSLLKATSRQGDPQQWYPCCRSYKSLVPYRTSHLTGDPKHRRTQVRNWCFSRRQVRALPPFESCPDLWQLYCDYH